MFFIAFFVSGSPISSDVVCIRLQFFKFNFSMQLTSIWSLYAVVHKHDCNLYLILSCEIYFNCLSGGLNRPLQSAEFPFLTNPCFTEHRHCVQNKSIILIDLILCD